MQHISYFVKVSETNSVLHLFIKCNTKMTPTSQEIVSGEVLSEHVCGVLVSCYKV
jgi:phage-related protein